MDSTVSAADFLDQLKHLLHEQNALVQISRDDDARYNAIVRDANEGRQCTTQFTLKPVTKCRMKDRSTPSWSSYSPLPLSLPLHASDQSH